MRLPYGGGEVVPCVEPAAGWRPQAGAPVDDGTSYEDLIAFISANRDRFTQLWEAHPDGPPVDEATYLQSRKVMVVGTTGDVDAARAELSATWPGNLDVRPVRDAAADLERIAHQLNAVTTTSIEAFVDVRANRVKVSIGAVDQPTLSIRDGFDREVIAILR